RGRMTDRSDWSRQPRLTTAGVPLTIRASAAQRLRLIALCLEVERCLEVARRLVMQHRLDTLIRPPQTCELGGQSPLCKLCWGGERGARGSHATRSSGVRGAGIQGSTYQPPDVCT